MRLIRCRCGAEVEDGPGADEWFNLSLYRRGAIGSEWFEDLCPACAARAREAVEAVVGPAYPRSGQTTLDDTRWAPSTETVEGPCGCPTVTDLRGEAGE